MRRGTTVTHQRTTCPDFASYSLEGGKTIDTTKFDHLFAVAAPRISSGTHQRDEIPRDGGRWPVSVVLMPSPSTELARALDALTLEAAELAGPGHWQTGQLGSAHLTVRALEPRREVIPPDDPAVARYCAALRRATARSRWPIGFRVTGLTLTPGTVMACAEPLDAAADTFSDNRRCGSRSGPLRPSARPAPASRADRPGRGMRAL